MSIEEDLEKIQKKADRLETQSFAMNILEDYKKNNKRIFIVLIITLVMWFATIGYLVYIINNTGYETITEIADTEGEGNACVGDNCNNGDTYGEGN